MKAIVQAKYGSPDVLQVREINKPVAKNDQVLVRVRAAAINAEGRGFESHQPLRINPANRGGCRGR
jgi:hypothetical protein